MKRILLIVVVLFIITVFAGCMQYEEKEYSAGLVKFSVKESSDGNSADEPVSYAAYPPKIDFTVSIRALNNDVHTGDAVEFEIMVENTGDADIDSIKIFSDGIVHLTANSIPAGDSETFITAKTIMADESVVFEIKATSGSKEKTEYTSAVSVNVIENMISNIIKLSNGNIIRIDVIFIGSAILAAAVILTNIALIIVLVTQKRAR